MSPSSYMSVSGGVGRRRTRSEVNKRPHIGRINRQWGICKKANTFFRMYNVDIAVIMRLPDGQTGGYESQPGLAERLFLNGGHELFGPTEVEGLESRVPSQTAATDQHAIAPNPSSGVADAEGDQPPNSISTEKVLSSNLTETGPIDLTSSIANLPSTSAQQSTIEERSIEIDPSIVDSGLNMCFPSTLVSNHNDTKPVCKMAGQASNADPQADSAVHISENRTVVLTLRELCEPVN